MSEYTFRESEPDATYLREDSDGTLVAVLNTYRHGGGATLYPVSTERWPRLRFAIGTGFTETRGGIHLSADQVAEVRQRIASAGRIDEFETITANGVNATLVDGFLFVGASTLSPAEVGAVLALVGQQIGSRP